MRNKEHAFPQIKAINYGNVDSDSEWRDTNMEHLGATVSLELKNPDAAG